MGRVSLFDSAEESMHWTQAPSGDVLAAFARQARTVVTVREGQSVQVIGPVVVPRIEESERPFWG